MDVQDGRFHLGHRPALDGLRAVAILTVFLHHLRLPYPKGGAIGVDIFFVLSGFLITALLCEEWTDRGRISLGAFYQRRALRLFPALIFLLLFLLVFWQFPPLRPELLRERLRAVWVSGLYLMNWFTALGWITFSPLSHTWSLANEEQFYLVWPLLLTLLLRSGARRTVLAGVVVLGILSSTAFRAVHWEHHHNDLRLYYALDSRADGLMMGALLGLVATWNLLPRREASLKFVRALGGFSAIFLAYVAWTGCLGPDLLWNGGMTAVNVGATLLILSILCSRSLIHRTLELAPLRWIGRISYGLYLWHYPVCQRYLKDGRPDQGRRILVAIAVTFALTCLSYYCIERPLLRYKKRPPASHPLDRPTA